MIDFAKGSTPSAVPPSASPDRPASSDEEIIARFETMVSYNLDKPYVWSSERIDSLMARVAPMSVGERIAFWAEQFHADGSARYVFGLDPEGYVRQGRLCDDYQTDCVLFFYRTTELGRSFSAREAVQFAFGTRFYGASVDEAILPDGRVQYEHDSHLEYSEEILKSGVWGKDVSASIGPLTPDPGNSRFAAGTLQYVAKESIDYEALRSGDVVYFILNENVPRGAEMRGTGILIQHLGIISRDGATPFLIHAAKTGLAGYYDGGRIARVPLKDYLDRVELFKGIAVSRIEEF